MEQKPELPRNFGRLRAIPGTVIALGFVSLFMDTSSELIHSLLPAFLVSVLGASALSIGIIEGVAEGTTSLTKIFSGAISDWVGRRKPLILSGYGLAAITKPLFALATGVGTVFVARFVDRIGKGIRGAPRDALIADVTPVGLRGSAFGLRQSMDTVGAFVGPLLAMALMAASHDQFRLVFWIATAPAFIAVLLVMVGVQEPPVLRARQRRSFPIRRADLGRFELGYWWLIGVATALMLARFSEAFLLLAGQHVGMALAAVPGVLITMNAVYAVSAYPLGRLADRMSRYALLALGAGILIAADAVLATAGTTWQVLLGAALWGLHMGATQGLLSALVADAAPPDLRGTAFGVYGLISGVAVLASSIIAGWLWTEISPGATFTAGAAFASVTVLGIAARVWSARDHSG